jgi:hypothetical protein
MRTELNCFSVNSKFINKARNAYLTPNISNNARNGWFVIPSSGAKAKYETYPYRKKKEICMKSIIHYKHCTGHDKQNEI